MHITKGSNIRRQKEISSFRKYHNVKKLELPWKQPSHILLNGYFSRGVLETSFVSLKLGGDGSCVCQRRVGGKIFNHCYSGCWHMLRRMYAAASS